MPDAPTVAQEICGWCGLPEDTSELRMCDIRGKSSQICLGCFAEISKYTQKFPTPPPGWNPWLAMPTLCDYLEMGPRGGFL